MGRAKAWMMEREALEPMFDWIEESFGDDAGEEGTDEWEAAVKAYDDHCEELRRQEEDDRLQFELEWYIQNETQIGKFDTQISSVHELLDLEVSSEAQFSLLVMLHGHIVAAVESYLASTFIHQVTNSDELIRKLIESDPVFSEMKFTLKDIYKKHENLQLTVANYLREMIFHKLDKVKPMFKSVLNCDFGDISWLFNAVNVRHHCVHRAGLDKDGNKINLSKDSVRELASRSSELVHLIEVRIDTILFPN